ncbi:MAG: hypothetical protein ACE5MH_10990, partial [Terriglobia bacterium]
NLRVAATAPPDLEHLRAATRQGTAEAWRAYANALVVWGGVGQLGDAIAAYERALTLEPEHGPTYFRLGVAYRLRYDSDYGQPADFQQAVAHWGKALATDPNQYIWRRRIQQYGPRLNKPYPFYDWVRTARKEIVARGETPAALWVEPGGAEFAHPAKSFVVSEVRRAEPGLPARIFRDEQGRIYRDERGFIKVEKTVVPAAIAPGASARAHVVFRPNLRIKAHWNNEVDGLVFWINPPEGWQVDSRYLTVPNAPQAVSQESRKVEFELRCPQNASPGPVTIPAYALYYVCEDVNGTCLYRRQDVNLQVKVRKP